MDNNIKILTKFEFYNPKFEYEAIFPDLDWPWAGHKYFAYDLVRNIKPKTIVELGTHKGTSFFSMCQAVKDEQLDCNLYAIDSWEGDKQAGFYDNTVLNEVKEIKDKFYKSLKINLIKKYFDDALLEFEDNSIDLLHIDGLHTYEAVRHDFNNWISKVKKDGIVMFHDIAEKKEDFGVYKLWDELKNKYSSLEFFHSHGLGVLFLKPQQNNIFCFPDIWSHYYDKTFNLNVCQTYKAEINLKLEKIYKEIDKEISYYQSKNLDLIKKIEEINRSISNDEIKLNKIFLSKYFKLWQTYCNIKKIIKK
ncbi:MAG: class I SAM-dependent methyltransferase [Candidatus Shapirobacteria bacterium]|nr:class I SAM-dependent methyltransferase [Candidatus Shapirobacteria bacterium]MDD4410519.1 class I SAM-dependent methyltransferase [Candidatus Shapirobacteria bacterium]